jgi:hypothetical protein
MSIDESLGSMDLKKIASFLRTRQESAEYLEKVAKDKNIYIRVSYSGFRAISIHPKQPCGAVPGFNGYVQEFEKVKDHLERLPKVDQLSIGNPGNNKPEHRLQAYLIYHSLVRERSMPEILGCKHRFDELTFVTDELKLENMRSDMLFLARKDDVFFPVLVELKNSRLLGRLQEQLQNTNRAMIESKLHFETVFQAVIGKDKNGIDIPIDFSKINRVIIWPRRESGGELSSSSAEFRRDLLNCVLEFCPDALDRLLDRDSYASVFDLF